MDALPPATPRRRHPAGFALLITITLLAFLVILLVGLATLTRVEVQVSSNTRGQAQARQHALFALQVALGQLQRHVGPDQRSTARADILSDTRTALDTWSGTQVTPLGSTVFHNNTLLTGVWGNRADRTAAAPNSAYINTPQLLTWLTSGNEDASYTINTTAPNSGRLVATASVQPGKLTSAQPLSTALIPSATQPAVQMIGPGTVGGTNTRAMVAALTQPLTTPAAMIPGQDPNGPALTTGRYAYAIADEAVKAKFNLTDPWFNSTADNEKRYRYQSAQKNAISLLNTAGNLTTAAATPTPIGTTAYDQNSLNGQAIINKAITPQNIPTALGLAQSVLQNRYHDLTTYSQGLLTNVREGGLKKDLTAAFPTQVGAAIPANAPTGKLWQIPAAALGTSYGADMLASNTTATFDGKGPDWQVLRSYAQLSQQLISTPAGYAINPIAPSAPASNPTEQTQMGVFPVIVGYQIFTSSRLIAVGADFQIELRHTPVIMLWNPYNVILKNATYGFEQDFMNGYAVYYARVTQADSANTEAPSAINAQAQASSPYFYRRKGLTTTNGPELKRTFKFEAESGDMEPGRAYVYALPADKDTNDSIAANYPAGTFKLVRGWVPGGALGYSIVARSGVFPRPPTLPLAGANNYYLRLWWGGTAGSYQNMPNWNDAQPIPPAVGDTNYPRTPSNDRLLMRLGSVNGPPLQGVGYNNCYLPMALNNSVNLQIGKNLAPNSGAWCGFRFLHKGTQVATANGSLNSNQLTAWLTSYNPRATNSYRSAWEAQAPAGAGYYNNNPSFTRDTGYGSGAPTSATFYPANYNGDYYTFGLNTNTPIVLYDIPRPDQPLLSLAALQHADIYRAIFNILSTTGNYQGRSMRLANNIAPAYAIANSRADQRVGLDLPYGFFTRTDADSNNITGSNIQKPVFFDHSFLANQALWDDFYFSSVPAATTTTPGVIIPLPNGRHRLAQAPQTDDPTALRDVEQSAARLTVDGAFNINSTSEEAWRAVLASTLNVPVGTQTFNNEAPLPRLGTPRDDTQLMRETSTAELDVSTYGGYRALTPTQLNALAKEIVLQVKARGPFVSLADFVNRALLDPTATPTKDLRMTGALQAAIDQAGLNQAFSTSGSSVQDLASTRIKTATDGFTPYNRVTSTTVTPAAAGAPGWVSQADLLQALGPILTTRADTFTVRVYGEVVNPLTSPSDPAYSTARAWAEAIVQRLPDYVLSSPTDDTNGADGDAAWAHWDTNLKNSTNQKFGRRLKIISFRWLSTQEI